MNDPRKLLKAAKTILLVDWPNPGIPRALLKAGFSVFSFSPGRYSQAELVAEPIQDAIPPNAQGETSYLVFRRLKENPTGVDIVNVY